jgi:2-polyprenyl-6-methoxyphenol hydroxylase-like FAD-dependent oxidoreductase
MKEGIIIDEEPMISTYLCMFGATSSIPGMTDNVFWESHGTGIATQFASFDGGSYFSILKRLKDPTNEIRTFNEEEKSKFFENLGDTAITSTLKWKDLKQYCKWTRLTYQPEGASKRWYHGRIVLCGESTTQMTSIAGMGFNTAFQSAVVLCNKLKALSKSNSHPNVTLLEKVFKDYQDIRQIETKFVSNLSGQYVRWITWNSWLDWFFIEYIAPWMLGEKKMMRKLGYDVIAKGRKLGFIAYEDRMGKITWKY